MIKKIILLLIFSSFLLQAQAQGTSEEPTSGQSSSKVVELYREKLAEQSTLYLGRVYTGFDNRITGHAFFLSGEWLPASILYDGVLYENVDLLFDIVREEVVVRHPNGFAKIKLLNERISWFSFSDHTFIRLQEPDSANGSFPEAGIYQELYEGDLSVLAKRKKHLKEHTYDTELIRNFEDHNRFYIKKDGLYYQVKSKRAVLNVLKDHKKEIRRFLRKNNIRYSNNQDTAIVKIAEYYDSLGH